VKNLLRDLGYALRQMRRSPGFTCAAVATMALGIGANAGVCSVVYGLLLESLPFRDAGRIVSILETIPHAPTPIEATYPDYLDWRTQQKSFESLAAYSTLNPTTVSLRLNDRSEQITRVLASGNFFSLLGVTPVLGRVLSPGDDVPGSDHVVVISTSAWQRYFGRDPGVVGHRMDLNGSSYTIIGVLPQRAAFPAEGEVWLPLSILDKPTQSSRVWHSVRVLGRLRPGVSVAAARTEMQTIAEQIAKTNPATNRNVDVQLSPLREQLVGTLRPAILCVTGSVLLVLLIACVNVANLFLVKAAARQRDMLVRQALGASRVQLFSQFVTQSLVICLLGGALGVALAQGSVPLMRLALSHVEGLDSSMTQSIRLSIPVLALTFGACVLTAAIFGILPILGIQRSPVHGWRLGDRGYTSGQTRRQNTLIASELAVAVIVLFLSFLMIRSFQRLSSVDPGYRTDHLLSFEIELPQPRYDDGSPNTTGFYNQLLNKLLSVPGVVSVGTTTQLPLRSSAVMTRFLIDGNPPAVPGAFPGAQIRFVTPGFFSTMGLGFRSGRTFTEKELSDSAGVFIVNQAFARQYLADRDPIGARIVIGVLGPHPSSLPVIGVVSSAHEVGVQADPPPEIFLPGFGAHEVLIVRTTFDPVQAIPLVRKALHELDPGQPIYHIHTLESVLSDSIALQRVTTILLAVFAIVAVTLATIGVYGILAYSVVQRTREIGLRMAVGAQREDMLKMVMGRAFRFATIGIVGGLILALLGAHAVNSLLFKTSAIDPLAIALTISGLIGMTAVAAAIPALRASRLNPTEALRTE
jgi:predicted permease